MSEKKTTNKPQDTNAINGIPVSKGLDAYRKAVALKYDGEHAPLVTATGEGDLAEDIIAIAREAGVPLYENAELTQMLSMLELGDAIPHELYLIIAQIIALAYKVKSENPEFRNPGGVR